MDGRGFPKVNRTYWLRAGSEIQRVKQNIRDSREMMKSWLELLGLEERQVQYLSSRYMLLLIKETTSENVKANVLQIQRITLTCQESIRELEDRQREVQHEIRQLGKDVLRDRAQMQVHQKQRDAYIDASLIQMHMEQRRNFAALQASFTTSLQPLLTQMGQTALVPDQPIQSRQFLVDNAESGFHGQETIRDGTVVRISATTTSQLCPSGCRCQCHTHTSVRTPPWLRSVVGQLLWSYNSSISMRSCNFSSCRKSLGKHHFTYYFPPWLVSRAFIASASLGGLFGTGAKVSVNIPLIIPEEDHIVWSIVMAGNLEQLRHLLSHDKNLIHIRNQWGQSIMHVSNISGPYHLNSSY